MYVLPVKDVGQSDLVLVGAKAAVLGTLLDAGFPVPPGLCVTTTAFQLALRPYRTRLDDIGRDFDHAHPRQATEAADAISEVLTELTLPHEVVVALQAALPTVGDNVVPVAVRSSATAEDRTDASFAGQYETVLGVRGEAAILEAILTCWRSFFRANALVARAAAGALTGDEAMGVLIQPMIDAECAGICFSVDPVQHRRDHIVVDAAWGLGVGAVDGSVPADTAWVHRDTFAIERRRIVEKSEQIVLASDGGVCRVAVAAERRRAACLPDSWLQRIAQFGLAAELLLGRPQDIEWAIADDQVFVLQSRPVTNLPTELASTPHFPVDWASDADRRRFWQLDPLRQGSIASPLEEEVREAFWLAFREAGYQNGRNLAAMGGPDREPRCQSINGRLYLHWSPYQLREGDRRARIAADRDLCTRIRDQGLTRWEYRAPEVIAATKRLADFDVEAADGGPEGARLAEHVEDAFGVFRHHWVVHWVPAAVEVFVGPYHAALSAVTGLTGPAAGDLATQLLHGEDNLFTELIDGIYALAETAREVPTVAALIAASPPDVLKQLSSLPEAAGFFERFEAFLAVYGDRSGAGFGSIPSIGNPTWREQPTLVLSLIAPYLSGTVEPPKVARQRAREERDVRVDTLCAASADPAAVAELRRWLPYARRSFTDLENHNHYIDQMTFGQLRRAVMAAGRWLAQRGVLTNAEDILWLRRDEVVSALREGTSEDLPALIETRRARHAEWTALEAPAILGVPEAQLGARPPLKDDVTVTVSEEAGRLVGQPASVGRHRGRARVISMETMLPDVAPGDILVAENAGPMWTPIFPILGGLVLDRGVLFQHAATTAREYGVPAVINTQYATRRIPDGAWVTVDGTLGTVEIEK